MQEQPETKPFDKFRQLVRRVVSVPKKEIDRREAEQKQKKQNLKEKHS
jgi:hypothetical protein